MKCCWAILTFKWFLSSQKLFVDVDNVEQLSWKMDEKTSKQKERHKWTTIHTLNNHFANALLFSTSVDFLKTIVNMRWRLFQYALSLWILMWPYFISFALFYFIFCLNCCVPENFDALGLGHHLASIHNTCTWKETPSPSEYVYLVSRERRKHSSCCEKAYLCLPY